MCCRFLLRNPLIAALHVLLLCLLGFQFRHYFFEVIPSSLIPDAAPWHPTKSHGTQKPSASIIKTSRLHYLVYATESNLELCYHLASAAANRLPVPTLLAWGGTGEFDTAETHLAKMRALLRYLNHNLPPATGDGNDGEDKESNKTAVNHDDDLVIVADGYDIVVQLPSEIWIERYFELAARADVRLADRFGISLDELHARGMRETIFWGADMFCFPMIPQAPRCWAAPAFPHLHLDGADADGSKPLLSRVPRWLNSGTVMGPLGDVRRLIEATMAEINATYDPAFDLRESDQYYLGNIWALQEYSRELAQRGGGGGGALDDDPSIAPWAPADRILPAKHHPSQNTELHTTLDYEAGLFQDRAGFEPYLADLRFNGSDLSALLPSPNNEHEEPIPLPMPANLEAALTRLYDDVPHAHNDTIPASDWIRQITFGVNTLTRQIYGMWHCTGPKDYIAPAYEAMWFHDLVAPLLRANVRASRAASGLISDSLIDGRRWQARTVFPEYADLDEYGGAWPDVQEAGFLPWKKLCGEHQDTLFAASAP